MEWLCVGYFRLFFRLNNILVTVAQCHITSVKFISFILNALNVQKISYYCNREFMTIYLIHSASFKFIFFLRTLLFPLLFISNVKFNIQVECCVHSQPQSIEFLLLTEFTTTSISSMFIQFNATGKEVRFTLLLLFYETCNIIWELLSLSAYHIKSYLSSRRDSPSGIMTMTYFSRMFKKSLSYVMCLT